jgi:tetratricopeptide (TPR) repeat protein
MEASIVIAHESGEISTELRARSNLSSTLWSSDPRRAIEMQAANYELACRVGNRQMANWIIQSLVAGTWLNGGDWDAVLAAADEALATVRDVSEEASILSAMCLIRVARGEPTDDALQTLESAAEQLSDPLNPAQVHALKADRALVRGDNLTAFGEFMAAAEFRGLASIYQTEAARSALWSRDPDLVGQVLAQLDGSPDADRAATLAVRVATRAGLAALEGRRQEALAGYRDAFERHATIGYDFARARVELDAILLLGTDAPELRAAADHARAVFERLRARPYLDWLVAATGALVARGATAPAHETGDREVVGRS